MNSDLEIKLWNAGQQETPYTQETWYKIIDALLDDFQDFVGENFHRDPDILRCIENPYNPSFVRWMWTDEKASSPLKKKEETLSALVLYYFCLMLMATIVCV